MLLLLHFQEEKKDEVILTKEEFRILQKVAQSKTVIQVGDSKKSDEELLERYKEINADLRRKVAISTQEKSKFQTEIERLKVIAGGDNGSTLKMMESTEREINRLKKQNAGYYTMDKENANLKTKVRKLGFDIDKLTKESDKKILSQVAQIEKLTSKNKKLQKEIKIRIDADTRFEILDL